MKNSNSSSNTSAAIPNWILLIVLITSFAGFLDSIYLTAKHYAGDIPECTLLEGCEEVLTSSYSEIFGIPVALFGSIFYFTILILGLLYFDTKKKQFIQAIIPLTFLGFAGTLYFLYLQAFVIGSWCQFCLISAATSTILLETGILIWIRTAKPRPR